MGAMKAAWMRDQEQQGCDHSDMEYRISTLTTAMHAIANRPDAATWDVRAFAAAALRLIGGEDATTPVVTATGKEEDRPCEF